MKIICFAVLLALPLASGLADDGDQIYTALLQEHVIDGWVVYEELCGDARLEQYIARLAETNPEQLATRNEKLAFWLNVYNAYTLKVICDNYPLESINELHVGGRIIGHVLGKTVWDRDLVVVNQRRVTLNDVEHRIIRPEFKEPRIHFALVCAAQSCPPLLNEAFVADRLEQQLDHLAREFLNDRDKNEFDAKNQVARLSKIFDWYESDFGRNKQEVLLFVADYLPAEVAESIKAAPSAWKVSYKDYDWSLNEVKR